MHKNVTQLVFNITPSFYYFLNNEHHIRILCMGNSCYLSHFHQKLQAGSNRRHRILQEGNVTGLNNSSTRPVAFYVFTFSPLFLATITFKRCGVVVLSKRITTVLHWINFLLYLKLALYNKTNLYIREKKRKTANTIISTTT